MHSFDASPIAPVGTETMIHLKPVSRHTYSYHAVKDWHFAPLLNHYCVIKTTNEAGAVLTTDTCKYNHHLIKTPTITSVNRIIKTKKIGILDMMETTSSGSKAKLGRSGKLLVTALTPGPKKGQQNTKWRGMTSEMSAWRTLSTRSSIGGLLRFEKTFFEK